MHLAAMVTGALVVVGVLGDACRTTLAAAHGPGPLSSRVLSSLWRLLLTLHRGQGHGRGAGVLPVAGALLLTCTVLLWVLLLWAGWSLLFWGADTVVSSSSGRPAGAGEVVHYAGVTLITLGTGDFVAGTATWGVVSVLTAFSGLFLVTLAITYLVAVVGAVVQRRALALRVRGLGGDATEIVTRAWRGGGFTYLSQQQLMALLPDIATGAEQHLAYPVLHYFHAGSRDHAASQAIVDLDEALLLMTAAVRPELRPDPNVTEPLRHVIGRYLDTVSATGWVPDATAPPPPPVAPLAEAGIPLAEQDLRVALDRDQTRRRALHRMLRGDGWEWSRP